MALIAGGYGLTQVLTGVLIFQQHLGPVARCRLAGISAMLTVLVMFVFPLWAMAVLTIDA